MGGKNFVCKIWGKKLEKKKRNLGRGSSRGENSIKIVV
jgi:hypothetical protein